jgi:hypothetical protein
MSDTTCWAKQIKAIYSTWERECTHTGVRVGGGLGLTSLCSVLVPVPKMHKKVSACDDFGVTEEDVFQPYCKDTYTRLPFHSWAVCQASYDEKVNGHVQSIRF